MQDKLKKNAVYLGILIVYLLFFLITFKITGALFILLLGLMFILPAYLLLRKFSLEEDEKFVLAFILGLGIFPSFVYYLGFLTKSLVAAAVIMFVLFLGISFFLLRMKK